MKKKVKKLTIALVVVITILLVITAAYVVTRMELKEESENYALALEEMAANKQLVYVVSTEDGAGIEHGEIIEEGVNVMKQTVYTGLENFNYITADDLGTTAIVDIYEGMTVMANMVTPLEIETDSREYEVQVVNLMVDQKENDYVDIRIMFPDGSDYLVLPKKQVKNLAFEESVFWTYLNEEEILRMASATIDAYTITGTKIYATRYVESNLQDKAIPTYLVNASVQDMMDNTSVYYDHNLLTKATTTLNALARKNLEERLGLLSEEKLDAVATGHNIEDTAKNSVLTGLGGYDYENAVGSTEDMYTYSEQETEEIVEDTATEE
ncbi:MAG: hypothetical protein UHN47_03910 [Lachnospiraceae bacterium]|nr:hypothetical protein [Lachnospiraceae bacterium]